MLKRFLRKIKRLCRSLFSLVELWCWRRLRRYRAGHYGDKIFIIQDCHIGDFLIALPYFQRLKVFYNQKMVLISDQRIAPLAMECGCFNEVIAIDMKKASSYKHLFYRWKTFLKLRTLSGRILIQKYSVGGTSLEDCMAVIIGAAEKIGVDSDKTNSNGGCGFYGTNMTKIECPVQRFF